MGAPARRAITSECRPAQFTRWVAVTTRSSAVARRSVPRFVGAGLVVDAGVDDAAVVAGLVVRDVGLFFEQDEPRAWRPVEDGARRRQPDDAAADDRDVVGHGALLYVITRTTTARGGGSRDGLPDV